ncbi:hypothetical protein GCM10010222_44530 [Streptomyces tanashiensis]|uniref:hypothetical protein n=1 Tax=Streptomyces tanashiensis TaxID=67367 RepID=UPI001677F8B2|nr:hypothetical protein [Streptomyces tanashiensis]GGS97918.1 hypothetical protein GCM10010222_44530 [Streptomyces tanashiensis]
MSSWGSWGVVAGGAVLILTPSVAVLAGWRPGPVRRARAPVPFLGMAGLAAYGAVLADEVPRLAGASGGVRLTCAYIALGLIAVAIALVILYDFLSGRARRGRP